MTKLPKSNYKLVISDYLRQITTRTLIRGNTKSTWNIMLILYFCLTFRQYLSHDTRHCNSNIQFSSRKSSCSNVLLAMCGLVRIPGENEQVLCRSRRRQRRVKPRPHKQQYQSNVRLCCQTATVSNEFIVKFRPFDKVETNWTCSICFDFVEATFEIKMLI